MATTTTQERVKRLEQHLSQENPVLAQAVESFQRLDRIARKLGLMSADESYATQVSWWPLIAVLGTFSAGKSTFLNEYIGQTMQRTGNQAVDDKFTVICYGSGEQTTLPGLALDSDPRFPLYRISNEIAAVARGEGRRVDSYLQLKTCEAEMLRNRIFIDSPGFDADQQRSSTLLITDQIMDLSDLVLVFFDARHPEPGAMRDTLEHLVANTVQRADSNKFLYILNQIDNTAHDDNPEEVVAAWQRALAQQGLTAGRFYRIFSRDAAPETGSEQVRERLERKRDEDMADIEVRIRQVEVERAYRVVGALENTAKHIEQVQVPALETARRSWRRRTLWLGAAVFGTLTAAFLWLSIDAGMWNGIVFEPLVALEPTSQAIAAGVLVLGVLLIYLKLRAMAGKAVLRKLASDESLGEDREPVTRAFQHNLKAWWLSPGTTRPRNWTRARKRQLAAVLKEADSFVQSLNDRYASPSGGAASAPGGEKEINP